MIKTLIFNGSPRKNGHTRALINELVENLEGEKVYIDAYYADISPCNDCRYCWKNPGCIIEDEMQKIYDLVEKVDFVVIASPLYFGELTGNLLNIFSRFQMFYARKYILKDKEFKLNKKKGAVLLTGGSAVETGCAQKTAAFILKHINAELIKTIVSFNTDKVPAVYDKKALEEIRELAANIS